MLELPIGVMGIDPTERKKKHARMARLFGTDGVRGVANAELTPMLAMSLGLAAGNYFRRGKAHPTFVIGRDSRLSSTMLESAIAAGLSAMGARVVTVGLMPTPAVACVTREIAADAGVVISASHNPFPDNGIKFFGHDGYKLDDNIEAEIENMVENAAQLERPTGPGIGSIAPAPELRDHYAIHMEETAGGSRLDGLKIVVDGANGAASELAPRILADLGATVISINCEPDGVNINLNCGALHPDAICAAVRAHSADVGIALDGDADRVILCDEHGAVVDGDRIMLICGVALANRGELFGNTVVATVMSNMGLEVALRAHGINLVRTNVGDRYVSERMKQDGFVLGGEKSGHVIFGSLTTTGDGIVSALQVLKAVAESGRKLSNLASEMTEYPQTLLNIRVSDRTAWERDADLCERIRSVEADLAGRGRVNVRASGTEKLVRVMVEAPNADEVHSHAESLALLIRQKWGVA